MKKIFIADDDRDILDILRLMLESQGYLVQATTNADDVFISNEPPADLILLDIWMSGIDGREICRRLQSSPSTNQIPIIFVSANSQLPEIAMEHKVAGYLAKPFDMHVLLATVKAALA